MARDLATATSTEARARRNSGSYGQFSAASGGESVHRGEWARHVGVWAGDVMATVTKIVVVAVLCRVSTWKQQARHAQIVRRWWPGFRDA